MSQDGLLKAVPFHRGILTFFFDKSPLSNVLDQIANTYYANNTQHQRAEAPRTSR